MRATEEQHKPVSRRSFTARAAVQSFAVITIPNGGKKMKTGKKLLTCFQYRKQVLGEMFGFGRGRLPFPLFNPSANQDDRKHNGCNHSGDPYGRKHPYPTPLDNSQQLQHNKDNRQNGYDAKPALFCFIIHIVS